VRVKFVSEVSEFVLMLRQSTVQSSLPASPQRKKATSHPVPNCCYCLESTEVGQYREKRMRGTEKQRGRGRREEEGTNQHSPWTAGCMLNANKQSESTPM